MSYENYYMKELSKLRDSARKFGRDHPSAASFLNGQSEDPDVERLLQGMAYLLAGTQKRLDDQLPEVLSVFLDAINPEFMRPIPATTIIQFQPKSALRQSFEVAKGTNIDSQKIEETVCRFRTTQSVNVLPIALSGISSSTVNDVGSDPKQRINIEFECQQTPLPQIKFDSLRFFCAGDLTECFNVLAHIQQSISAIEVQCDNKIVELPPSCISLSGFAPDFSALPAGHRELPALHQLIEYYCCPEKFLFWDLDLSDWVDRPNSEKFDITLICKPSNSNIPTIREHIFKLYCAPAVNLFELETSPINVNHEALEYAIKVPKTAESEPQIYSVDKLVGLERGTGQQREYQSYLAYQSAQQAIPTYKHIQKYTDSSDSISHFLQLGYPKNVQLIEEEVLIPSIQCSNGKIAERLEPGMINVPTSNSPELVTFQNITLPSNYADVDLGAESQWQCLSHFVSNFRSMLKLNEFKSLLSHYLSVSRVDKAKKDINIRRIEGIAGIRTEQKSTIYSSRFIQGIEITISVKPDHYLSRGDMLCFGLMIDRFFGSCRPMNSFTQLIFEDFYNGERIQWPIQMGKMPTL